MKFVAYFWFVSWKDISLGLSIHLDKDFHIEIHIPFGFIKIGLEKVTTKSLNHDEISWRQKGIA